MPALPATMAFNLPATPDKFVDIAEAMGEITDDLPVREAAYLALEAVESLIEDCGIYSTLAEFGIQEKDFPALADVALTVARPLENNPRKVTKQDAIEIYSDAY